MLVRSLDHQRKKRQLTLSEQILIEKITDLERDLEDLRRAFSSLARSIRKQDTSTTRTSAGGSSAEPHDTHDK